ncbi:hypothetical protein [Nocardia abscessus]|uniref:hypothetical protein n=1 Tax=Nocardia abscessus TaxID=120957 RepID=UPI0002D88E3F|nr:hypothetical protein [Nocardia abscessus]MCC3329443.1 hypothetical protein [Nocardia abscessus]
MKLHQLSAAIDLGDLGQAGRIVDSIQLPKGYAKERTAYYWVDKARMYLGLGEVDAAIESLYEAREVAPEHLRSATIRSTIDAVSAQERRASRGVRSLAASAGMILMLPIEPGVYVEAADNDPWELAEDGLWRGRQDAAIRRYRPPTGRAAVVG